ncbi:hypothetical protein M885DRAFT_588963 [Pelagophyceae sp. CCMP2097]|nr:hypothetical protein M885DRAFT_588963 [Pelagophyceae sp. CCMP2097]
MPVLRFIPALVLCAVARGAPKANRLSPAQVARFDKDGYIIIKGLVEGRALEQAQRAAREGLYRHARRAPQYRALDFGGWRNKHLRRISLDGAAPEMAAQLMGLRAEEPMRALQDAAFALEAGDTSCGWHVDDKFFWPCRDSAPRDKRAGINVWVTLSPVGTKDGCLALAPGSHDAPWREKCRRCIAAVPAAGFPRTCDLAILSPACAKRCEAAWRTVSGADFDMAPGDAIIHSRYVFHRGLPFSEGEPKLRYSVRYMPAEAVLVDFRGQSGSKLADKGAKHPQVWPRPLLAERLRIKCGLADGASPVDRLVQRLKRTKAAK